VKDIKNEIFEELSKKMKDDMVDEFYEDKRKKFNKNLEISTALIALMGFYPIIKLTLRLIGKKRLKYIYDPEYSGRAFDEILGFLAGIILGKEYSKKHMETIEKITDTKDVDTDNLVDDIVDDIAKDMVEDSKKLKKKEEPDFNILTSKEELFREEEEYKKIKSKISINSDFRKRMTIFSINSENHFADIKMKNIDLDPQLKGIYLGSVAKEIYGVDVEPTFREKVHKFLCTLSLRSKNLSKLYSMSMTHGLILIYLLRRTSGSALAFYKNNKKMSGKKIKDFCELMRRSTRNS
jgi:hypothetical protein